MHRALTIPEIVDHIFDDTIADFSLFIGSKVKALAALARTCIAFRDPALDLLWRAQDTVDHFLNCFPPGLMVVVKRDAFFLASDEWIGLEADDLEEPEEALKDVGKDLCFSRPVTEEDWQRPLFYSNRIKSLVLWDHDSWIISSSAFQKLCTAIPGGGAHIFPNLGFLELHYRRLLGIHNARSIHFLISPQMRRICLQFCHGRWAPLLTALLPFFDVHSPSLTHAHIWIDDYRQVPDSNHRRLLDSISGFVQNLRRIEDLRLNPVNEVALKHLAGLPSLTELRLENPICDLPAVDTSIPDHSYSSLTHLYFGSTTVKRVIGILNLIVNARLQLLSIEGFNESEPTTTDATAQLCSSLAARSSHDSLKTFTMGPHDFGYEQLSDRRIFAITGHALRQLYCFNNLIEVDIDHPCGFDLTDDDIFGMASSWPRVKSLVLNGSFRQIESHVTLRSLSVFAQYCPELETLELTVNSMVVPELGPESRCHHALERLFVGYGTIAEAAPVAAYISAVFPKAAVLSSWHEDRVAREDEVYLLRWREVEVLVGNSDSESD